DPGDPGVSREAADFQWIGGGGEPWERAGALGFNPVRKQFPPGVVPPPGVRAMEHGGGQPFEPGGGGDRGVWLEPAGVVQRAAPVDQTVDLLAGLLDHPRYRPFDPDISIVLYSQPRTRTPLEGEVSKDADVGLREERPRILTEQENSRVRQFAFRGQEAAGLEEVPNVTLRPGLRPVVLDQLGVQEVEAQTIRDREAVVLALP